MAAKSSTTPKTKDTPGTKTRNTAKPTDDAKATTDAKAPPKKQPRAERKSPEDYPVLLFDDDRGWEAWLAEHHADTPGVWLRFAKKKAPYTSLTYVPALDVALCYGWIDSQVKTFDEHSYLQKFTPRGRKSLWSKINREKVAALESAGRMRAPGIAAVDAAKADGRWDAAYDPVSAAQVPDELQRALDASPRAQEFFLTLDRINRYAVIWRVQTAKRIETRERRIAQLIAMLERGEKIH